MCETHSLARCIVLSSSRANENDDAQSRPEPWHTSTRIVINGLRTARRRDILGSSSEAKVIPTSETSRGGLLDNSVYLSPFVYIIYVCVCMCMCIYHSHSLEYFEFWWFLTRARRKRGCKFNAVARGSPQVHRKRSDTYCDKMTQYNSRDREQRAPSKNVRVNIALTSYTIMKLTTVFEG